MKPVTPSKQPHIRILLVDDHPAVRQGLAGLLTAEGMEVHGEASGRVEALSHLAHRRPSLAIVDLSLNGEDGTSLIAELHQHEVPVLVYSMHNDAQHVQGAIAAGALGYVTKREFHSVLTQAIREVAAGHRFVSPHAAEALAESLTGSPSSDGVHKLSDHERKVYELLGGGADTYEIAATLGITNHTVESYYSRVLIKLDLNGMHELRRHAIAHLKRST